MSEKLATELKNKAENKKKKKAVIGLGLVLLGGILAFILWPGAEEAPKTYADAGGDTVHQTRVDASEIYNITSQGVAPASHTVKLGNSVGFRNKLKEEVVISFDRSNDTIELDSGGTETLLINGITYFQVNGNDFSASGRVNVQ